MRFLLVSVDDPKITRNIQVPEAITVRKTTCAKPTRKTVKVTTFKVNSQVKLKSKKKQLSRAIIHHGHSRDKQTSRSS